MSVRVKGRPREAVLADMIEGVVITNGLEAPEADRLRNDLWTVMAALGSESVAGDRGVA